MFSLHMERSRSDSSASSDSSTLSLSPSGWNPAGVTLSPPTTTTTPFGSALDWQHIPKPARTRSTGLMPKRARTAPGGCASAPEYTYETFCPSSGQSSYAYPHWPSGDSLSASPADGASTSGPRSVPSTGLAYAPPSSRVSDDDLEGLDFDRADCPQPPSNLESVAELPVGGPSLAAGGISWSQVGTGAPLPPTANAEQEQQQQPQRRRRLPPPPAGFVMHRDGSHGSRRGKRNASSSPRKNADSAIC